MLPTFPTAQKILNAAYFKRILAEKAKVFPHDVHPPVRPIIEGKNSDFQREDRKVKPLEPKLHSVQATFDTKDGKGMTREVFESKARELGEGLGKQMWEMMFEAVEGAVAETGNSLQIKGGEFKQDDFIRMLEMTEHGFDEHGQPTNVLIVSPAMAEDLKKREAEWAQDEAFKAKVDEVKKRKKEAFDEREARRRLVD